MQCSESFFTYASANWLVSGRQEENLKHSTTPILEGHLPLNDTDKGGIVIILEVKDTFDFTL